MSITETSSQSGRLVIELETSSRAEIAQMVTKLSGFVGITPQNSRLTVVVIAMADFDVKDEIKLLPWEEALQRVLERYRFHYKTWTNVAGAIDVARMTFYGWKNYGYMPTQEHLQRLVDKAPTLQIREMAQALMEECLVVRSVT